MPGQQIYYLSAAEALAFEHEFDAPPWRLDSRIGRGD